jgi:murein DD-endopeptidase MepM/ murein hydrolase activator NlpD
MLWMFSRRWLLVWIAVVSSVSFPLRGEGIALQNQPSPWQGASFPVEDFVAYTSPFGYRQHPYGGYRFHYGLDIAAPSGSYIRAWWGGQVVEVTDDTACGTSLVIESDQWLHIYCHMQGHRVIESDGDRWFVDPTGGLKIRQGDWVEAGQPIGRVGLTGRTTGPHLHWGLKYQGTWVDPARVLQAMVAAQRQTPPDP